MSPRQQPFKLEWAAHEYEHKERSKDWYWAMGIITVSVAIVSIILGNIIFSILIIVGAFGLALFINRPPETIGVVVDEIGVIRGNVRYPYETLRSFWIDLEHPHNKIILRSRKLFMPLIVVPISDETDPDKLHEVLSQFLQEEYHALPFIERFLEYLGF